jgi:hypothetical protein
MCILQTCHKACCLKYCLLVTKLVMRFEVDRNRKQVSNILATLFSHHFSGVFFFCYLPRWVFASVISTLAQLGSLEPWGAVDSLWSSVFVMQDNVKLLCIFISNLQYNRFFLSSRIEIFTTKYLVDFWWEMHWSFHGWLVICTGMTSSSILSFNNKLWLIKNF